MSETIDPDVAVSDEGSHRASQRRSKHLIFSKAIHEASHAVIRLYLGLGNITKIAIVAPHGAYVAWEERELQEQTETIFVVVLVATLAGRAGEQQVIGTVGASGVATGRRLISGRDADRVRHGNDHQLRTEVAVALQGNTQSAEFVLVIDLNLAESVHARLGPLTMWRERWWRSSAVNRPGFVGGSNS